MAKRISENEKLEMVRCFLLGKTIEELAAEFSCTKFTISRNLKKKIGEQEYKDIINKNKSSFDGRDNDKKNIDFELTSNQYNEATNNNHEEEYFQSTPFFEITPLDYDIDKSSQKDLASVPISDIEFPKVVYMIVDKTIELEIKYLRDYQDWQFLSKDELNRKTIEIYQDLKDAKRSCNKEQKVIKVPNTEVFKIVAPILLLRGISRIISSDKLIAL